MNIDDANKVANNEPVPVMKLKDGVRLKNLLNYFGALNAGNDNFS